MWTQRSLLGSFIVYCLSVALCLQLYNGFFVMHTGALKRFFVCNGWRIKMEQTYGLTNRAFLETLSLLSLQ